MLVIVWCIDRVHVALVRVFADLIFILFLDLSTNFKYL
jgi:hypothetical protein